MFGNGSGGDRALWLSEPEQSQPPRAGGDSSTVQRKQGWTPMEKPQLRMPACREDSSPALSAALAPAPPRAAEPWGRVRQGVGLAAGH